MYFEILQNRLLERLNGWIRNGELTERSLARSTGISQPHVHNVLKGARALSPEVADRILKALRLSLLDLFDDRELEARKASRNGRTHSDEGPPDDLPTLEEVLDEARSVRDQARIVLAQLESATRRLDRQ